MKKFIIFILISLSFTACSSEISQEEPAKEKLSAQEKAENRAKERSNAIQNFKNESSFKDN